MKTKNIPEKSEYEIQAEEFLSKAGIEFKAELIGHEKHFPDDAEERDVYSLTLTRTKSQRSISFRFGQSIVNSLPDKEEIREIERKAWHNHTSGALDLRKRRLQVKAPSAYDLLAGIQKSSLGSFKEFCRDFDYNDDSIKASKTWQAVVEEWFKVESFFTPEELEESRNILLQIY